MRRKAVLCCGYSTVLSFVVSKTIGFEGQIWFTFKTKTILDILTTVFENLKYMET